MQIDIHDQYLLPDYIDTRKTGYSCWTCFISAKTLAELILKYNFSIQGNYYYNQITFSLYNK